MKVKILPSALDDLADGKMFYQKQAPALGAYFLDSLFADIDSLAFYGGIHRKAFGYFRVFSKRFPYAIYYQTNLDEIVVWRVLDCRRDPLWIQSQLNP